MTKIKLCGLTRSEDIKIANELQPDYIGFVFWDRSKRHITVDKARELKDALSAGIKAVGVFVDEEIDKVASLLNDGIIDIAQLHGNEDEAYIADLRSRTYNQVIKAYKIRSKEDVEKATSSPADLILLDAGMGDGETFDWDLIRQMNRPYILAGGLDCDNVAKAVRKLSPYGVDVSSGIETDGAKDPVKMKDFVAKVRKR